MNFTCGIGFVTFWRLILITSCCWYSRVSLRSIIRFGSLNAVAMVIRRGRQHWSCFPRWPWPRWGGGPGWLWDGSGFLGCLVAGHRFGAGGRVRPWPIATPILPAVGLFIILAWGGAELGFALSCIHVKLVRPPRSWPSRLRRPLGIKYITGRRRAERLRARQAVSRQNNYLALTLLGELPRERLAMWTGADGALPGGVARQAEFSRGAAFLLGRGPGAARGKLTRPKVRV